MEQTEIATAKLLLQQGEVVAFPTDTLYALGGNANSITAIAKVFEIKGRSYNQALPVLLPKAKDLFLWADEVSLNLNGMRSNLMNLVDNFWPGPLTIVVKKAHIVPNLLAAHKDTIALRVPNHPVALKLLQEFNSGIIGTSANKSGEMPLNDPKQIKKNLGESLFVLTGAEPPMGVRSTIIAVTDEIKILREGAIPVEKLKLYLGKSRIST